MARKILNGLDLQGQKITNVADPSTSTDAANKQYVDNVARGLKWKDPVRVASTTGLNLNVPGATIDGVTMVVGDRVLVKDQATQSQNGIYIWNGAGVSMSRSLDADGSGELAPGVTVLVTEGTTNADKSFSISSDQAITIGVTAITWSQVGGGTTYTASNGVQLSGSNFQGVAKPSGGLSVDANGFFVDTSVVSRKVAGNLGNGSSTSIAVTHNLGTTDVIVSLRETATGAAVMTDWIATDLNTVTFNFASAPAANAYRWMIVG